MIKENKKKSTPDQRFKGQKQPPFPKKENTLKSLVEILGKSPLDLNVGKDIDYKLICQKQSFQILSRKYK